MGLKQRMIPRPQCSEETIASMLVLIWIHVHWLCAAVFGAAPPSSVMKTRRLRSSMGYPRLKGLQASTLAHGSSRPHGGKGRAPGEPAQRATGPWGGRWRLKESGRPTQPAHHRGESAAPLSPCPRAKPNWARGSGSSYGLKKIVKAVANAPMMTSANTKSNRSVFMVPSARRGRR